jgi:membrane protein CcdC involved in cytochrome C biogenesis
LTAIIPGYLLAKETKIFKKEKEQYYKSSIIITVIWVALFIVRIGIEFFSPENLLLEGVTAVLLAFSAGLFVGEGLLIRNRLKINLG